jgi:hypothetical protein
MSLSADILTGIQVYLREHFPDTEFLERREARTRSVFLTTHRGPSYRLEITQTFLDGEGGATQPLNRIREWNLARALREANGRLVTLATTGISIQPLDL